VKTDVRHFGGDTVRVAWSILAALALMASILVAAAPPASAWPAKISIGSELNTNERLVSPNGNYNLLMQENGNLVLRNASGTILWHPEMDGSGSVKAEITDAGNVVLRQADGDVMWASGTTRWAGSATTLEVTDHGNVLLSNAAGDHLWRVGVDPAIHGVEAMIEYAKAQLDRTYKFGYHGPTWFDCSGLTLQAMRAGGVTYGDTNGPDQYGHTPAADQYREIGHVPLGDRRRGDLIFWDLDPDRAGIDHVAIYLGAGRIIEAAGPNGEPLQTRSLRANAEPQVARMFP
jgi:hypothetical protein